MKYRVGWTTTAENGMAAAWMASPDKAAFNDAMQRIEHLLATDAINAGEGRFKTYRIHFDNHCRSISMWTKPRNSS